ncbi:hypothetical protein I5F12_01330 [Proteus cibarius]|nr:hypothetical protein [Proteus terrae subsp. cibarius]QHD93263.1 hypothetical protein GSM99_00625 [Proteus terrae subsp. cibarius]QJW51801.1 hypothetical protein HND96_13365 [Proteus terrae subsp. cibarius]QKD68764.1 hypothetical protein HG541_04855 [Proteus terrae subsp. cibarius]QKD73938.1 hypothetical protein HG539_14260 [Proteus terrae subsp. cibarius]
MMSLLQNKKNVLAVFMATSVLALSGCAWTDHSRPIETPAPVQTTQPVATTQPAAVAQPLSMAPAAEPADSGVDARKLGLAPQSACIKQLDSLKTFSPSDYQSMMSSFKEISEINAMYRSVQGTASKDSLDLLKMSIESKTEVLCAKVRYLSIMSVNSTLKKLGE